MTTQVVGWPMIHSFWKCLSILQARTRLRFCQKRYSFKLMKESPSFTPPGLSPQVIFGGFVHLFFSVKCFFNIYFWGTELLETCLQCKPIWCVKTALLPALLPVCCCTSAPLPCCLAICIPSPSLMHYADVFKKEKTTLPGSLMKYLYLQKAISQPSY